jgi:hypothetical protein
VIAKNKRGVTGMALREHTVLFIQDDMIAEQYGVERTYYQFSKSKEPVVVSQFPWEGNRVYIFGSVEKPCEGPVRMWYQALDTEAMDSPDHMTICYAQSADGRHFIKPDLGICPYKAYRKTNIIMGNALYPGNPYCPSVIRDDDGSYKMTVWYEGWSDKISAYSGAKTFRSEDGLHFEPILPDLPFIEEVRGGPNDVNCLSPDKLEGKYVSYQVMQRYLKEGKEPFPRDLITGRERIIAMQESDDFITWSEPRTIIEPHATDPDFLQFYGLCGFRYGQYWLGSLWTYFVNDQSMGTELAVSRDGRTWDRIAAGHRIIPLGDVGSFDSGMLQTATAPIILGGEILLYYGGSNHYHDQDGSSSIGLATLPLDRWVSLKAGRRGSVHSKSFIFNGSRISVNTYARSGRLRVGILNAEGVPVPGFTIEDSDAIEEDALDFPLSWRGKTNLTQLSGLEISLFFVLEYAELFSYTIN